MIESVDARGGSEGIETMRVRWAVEEELKMKRVKLEGEDAIERMKKTQDEGGEMTTRCALHHREGCLVLKTALLVRAREKICP
jgi:hypothetical protein